MNSGMGGGNSGGSTGAAERCQRGSSREDGFARRRWGPESTGMLSLRESCKLFKNMEIQEKSGVEKRV